MKKKGVDEKMIESYLALASYQKAGGATAKVSLDIEEILQRPPLTIFDFAEAYKDDFT